MLSGHGVAKRLVDKYGKYLGVTSDKMVWAEKWFCKFGESAVFYTRLLPVVRTIVNVPAGLLGMNFYKFMAYSMAGALPWCLVLAYLGYTLGSNWESIMGYAHLLTYASRRHRGAGPDWRDRPVPPGPAGYREKRDRDEIFEIHHACLNKQ